MNNKEITEKDKVKQLVKDLMREFSVDTPSTKARLSKLRRAAGKSLDMTPEVWGIIFADSEVSFQHEGKTTRAGKAVHTTITMYAHHVQGDFQAHQTGVTLGMAGAQLVAVRESAQRRFDKLLATKNLGASLVGFISLLRQEKICLDYVQLVSDLYDYESARGKSRVVLSWGGSFYKVRSRKIENEDRSVENESDGEN